MGAASVDCKWLFLALLALQDHCGLNSSCWAADATIRAAGALRWRSSSPSAEEVSSSEPTSAVKNPQVEEKAELTPSTAVEDQECTIPISKNQDPYVMGSPLSVAAVCRDGIALVSLHYNVDFIERPPIDEENEDSKISNSFDLEEDRGSATSLIKKENNIDNTHHMHQKQQQLSIFRDLPLTSRGPLRIEPIHENIHTNKISACTLSPSLPPPMILLTAGWRTDGMAMADAARELMAEEARLYCLPSLAFMGAEPIGSGIIESKNIGEDGEGDANVDASKAQQLLEGGEKNTVTLISSDESTNTIIRQQQPSYHGRKIAEGLSYYLSKCAFSGGVRSLSCVGLLACGSSIDKGLGGSLYLIDATGTHRVRAHAIGNGSSTLHKRMSYVDFGSMDCREGLRTLLQLIAEAGGLVEQPRLSSLGGNGDNRSIMTKPAFINGGSGNIQSPVQYEETTIQQQNKWSIPPNAAVELAILKSGEGRMKRVRLPSL